MMKNLKMIYKGLMALSALANLLVAIFCAIIGMLPISILCLIMFSILIKNITKE